MASCGYLCDFVNPVPWVFYCQICHLPAREASIMSCCATTFCNFCIKKSLEKRPFCPSCGKKDYSIHVDINLIKSLEDFQVHCNMKTRGCEWLGPLHQLESHLDPAQDNCQYIDTICPHNCQQTISRNKLKQHVESMCPEIMDTYEDVFAFHLHYCRHASIECPYNCGVICVCKGMEAHLKVYHLQEMFTELESAGLEVGFPQVYEEDQKILMNQLKKVADKLPTEQPQLRIQEEQDKIQDLEKKVREQDQKIEDKDQEIKKVGEQNQKIEDKDQEIKKVGEQDQKTEDKDQEIKEEKQPIEPSNQEKLQHGLMSLLGVYHEEYHEEFQDDQKRLQAEKTKFQDNVKKFQDNQKKLQEKQKKLQDNQKKLQENQKKLQDNQRKIMEQKVTEQTMHDLKVLDQDHKIAEQSQKTKEEIHFIQEEIQTILADVKFLQNRLQQERLWLIDNHIKLRANEVRLHSHIRLRFDQILNNDQKMLQDNLKLLQDYQEMIQDYQKMLLDELKRSQNDKMFQDYQKILQDYQKMLQDEQGMSQDCLKMIQDRQKMLQDYQKIYHDQQVIQDGEKMLQEYQKILQDHETMLQDHQNWLEIDMKMFRDNHIRLQDDLLFINVITLFKKNILDQLSFTCCNDTPLNFTWKECGIQMTCSETKFTLDNKKCVISISVLSLKELISPEIFEPVSAAYHIDCFQTFTNPVTIKVQHCAAESSLKDLYFITSSDKVPPYKFHPIKAKFDSTHGEAKVHSFSLFLILKRIFGRSSLYSAYLYHSNPYGQKEKLFWDLSFYIVKKLPVCERSVKNSTTELHRSGTYTVEFAENSNEIAFMANNACPSIDIRPITPLKLSKRQINRHTMEEPPCCQLQLINSDPSNDCINIRFDMEGTKDRKFLTFLWPRPHGQTDELTKCFQAPKKLTIDDLGAVYDESYKASSKWYNIGLQLKVPVNALESIETSTPGNNEGALRKMLSHWLKNSPDPSWKSLASAMGKGAVGRHDLELRILDAHQST